MNLRDVSLSLLLIAEMTKKALIAFNEIATVILGISIYEWTLEAFSAFALLIFA